MSLLRALVFGLNARTLSATAALAASLTYALVAGGAASGLREAHDVLQEEILVPNGIWQKPAMAPFPSSDAPPGTTTLLVHAGTNPVWATTRTPWPHSPDALVPLPRMEVRNWSVDEPTLTAVEPQYFDGAQTGWVLIPPNRFDARFPELQGMSTVAVGTGPVFTPSPAADEFYAKGAEQIGDGLVFIAATSVFVGSVIAAVATRLELLARRPEYALVGAVGAPKTARTMALLRAVWTVALGLCLGLIVAYGLLAYANRSQQKLVLYVSPTYGIAVITCMALSAIACAWAVTWFSLRADVSASLTRRGLPIKRFPGPVRFTLVTPKLAPALAVAMAATLVTIGVVLGALDAPARILDPGDGFVMASESGNPLRGSVPRFVAEHYGRFNDSAQVSPELFVPTVLLGQPVMARGVVFDAWAELTGARLTDGRWPTHVGEAAIGERASARLGIDSGDHVSAPGAYRAVLEEIAITGRFAVRSLEADEILILLDQAASLAKIETDRVHLVRVSNPTNDTFGILSSRGIQVLGLSVTPNPPLEGLQAVASVSLLNVAAEESKRTLTLTVNGETATSKDVVLPPFGQGTAELPFRVPSGERLIIQVNPTLESQVVPSILRIQAHQIGTIEEGLNVTVTTLDGYPANNVTLTTPWGNTTAPEGVANVPLREAGPILLTAHTVDGFAGHRVYVTRNVWLNVAVADVTKITLRQTSGSQGEADFEAVLSVENVGGLPFRDSLAIVYGNQTAAVSADIPPFSSSDIRFTGRAPFGTFVLTAMNETAVTTLARDPAAPAPEHRTIDDAIAEKSPVVVETAESRTQRFLGDLFEAVEAAAAFVVMATVFHGAIVAWVLVRRETAERQALSATLSAVGARLGQIRSHAARDTLLSAGAGVALGLLLTPLILFVGGRFDLPHAFGHQVPVQVDAETIIRLSAVFLLVAVVAAVTSVRLSRPPAAHHPPRPLREYLE